MKSKMKFDLDEMMKEEPQAAEQEARLAAGMEKLAAAAVGCEALTAAYLAGKLEGMSDALRMMQRSA